MTIPAPRPSNITPLRAVPVPVEDYLASVPPHDREAENAVLGAMMCEGRAAKIAAEELKPTDFYTGVAQVLFACMVGLVEQQRPIDELIVRAELIRRGELEEVGGEDALAYLVHDTPNAANIEGYCRIVRECAMKRALIKTTQKTIQRLQMPDGSTAQQMIVRARQEIEEIEALTPANIVEVGADDLAREWEEAKTGKRYWLPFVWEKMSKTMKPLRPGGVAMLAGAPGVSKSFVTIQNVKFWEARGEHPIALMMEDGAAYHLGRALAQESGNHEANDYEWIKYNPVEASQLLEIHHEFIVRMAHCLTAPPRGRLPTIDWVLGFMRSRAKAGHKVIIIDPATAIQGRMRPQDDERFVWMAKDILETYQCRLFLTTHPRKQSNGGKPVIPSMDELAGGAAFSRFSQVIMYLYGNSKFIPCKVDQGVGIEETKANRFVQILKTRDGWGAGQRFAFKWEGLRLTELGRVEA